MRTLSVRTTKRDEMIDITKRVSDVVHDMGIVDGSVTLFVPHTTAGVTINENADSDVKRDMLFILDNMVPHENGYHHYEGNSAAHMKASMMGFSEQILVSGGALVLGTWQGIYFMEFDGPRNRQLIIADFPRR